MWESKPSAQEHGWDLGERGGVRASELLRHCSDFGLFPSLAEPAPSLVKGQQLDGKSRRGFL